MLKKLLIMPLLLLSGCGSDPSTLTSGSALFNHYCSGCHGTEGTGNFLRGIPANLVTQKNLSSIINQIKNGSKDNVKGVKMPAFPQLSNEQIKKIALHLLLLKQEYKEGLHRDKFLVTPK